MSSLTLFCLGQFTVMVGQQPVASFRTDKVRALLAYLALEARPHRREALAALLWPDIGEAYAAKNLRNTLHRLRQSLQASDPSFTEQLLISTRQTIALGPAHLVSDVQRFEGLISASTAHARSGPPVGEGHFAQCTFCLARLTEAAELYQGELLAGFSLADAPAFEEWLAIRREALHQQMVWLFFELAGVHETRGEWALAQRYTRRLLAIEPWREEPHRLLIRLLAQSGQRSAALAQYQQCCQVLKAEFGIEPTAETTALYEAIRSGGFDKMTRLRPEAQPEGWQSDNVQGAGSKWQDDTRNPQPATQDALWATLPVTLSPPHPVSSPPHHNLPAPLTPFVGRTRDLAKIGKLLQQGVRLLTLVGIGGMGKTRLALAVGRQALATYPDGVVFVALASLQSPTAIAPAIITALATTLGSSIQGGNPRTILCQFLQPRRLLLILDNFEHLLVGSTEGVDLVTALLQAAPGVQILVTSREHLHLRGEQLYQVQPLTVAANARLAEAAAEEATQLFVQSAQLAQIDFQLTATNLAVVLRICQLVQGMPLGLELAAAQVGTLPLRAIADAIQQNAAFLATDWHDLPERQRSLRAVFAWSWQLLTPEEQRALRQMSIFQGGFERTAAQDVINAPQPLLHRLCRKSLLQWQESASGEGRYTLHELLRQFAAEELRATDEGSAVAMKHGRYYLTYLAARGLRLGRGEPKEASAEIQAELDNIRLAWQWAATRGRLEELEQASYSWWQFCIFYDLNVEARSSFTQAITGVRAQRTPELAASAGDVATRLFAQRLLAKLLAIHADFLFAQGQDEEMATQAQEAIQLGAASGGVEGETLGTFVLGRVAQELGQQRKAGELWQQAIQLVRAYQPTCPESELLHEVHWMAYVWLRGNALHFGDYIGSRGYMVQALQIAQTLGKRRCELDSLCVLGQTDVFLFDFGRAEPSFVAALDLARPLGYRRSEIGAQDGLAAIARLKGDYLLALTLQEQAVSTAIELTLAYDESSLLAGLIRLHCQLGNQTAATQRLKELTQLLARAQLPRECHLAAWLAAALQAYYAGDAAVALQYAEQANQLNEQGEILFRQVDTALILGHTRAGVGQWEAAATAYQFALDAFQQVAGACGAQALAAEPQAGLAQLALAQGDLAVAHAQVEAILPVLAEHPHAGYNNPFFIYLTCYRVLVASADTRAATLLQQGYDLLQQVAAALDAEGRQRFFTAVPLHCALVTAYTEMQRKMTR